MFEYIFVRFCCHAAGVVVPFHLIASTIEKVRSFFNDPVFADFARTEASSKIANKNKKFFGLRKFADVAARRKKEALIKKATEAEEEAAAAKEEATVKPSKPIIAFLDVELPKVNKMNIEEYAESSFELNRKGIFGAKTTVPKILSWKNVRIIRYEYSSNM
jgi:hypothetical protein